MRAWLISLTMVCGCQCLVPVDERPDGGRVDGGHAGAGGSAGGAGGSLGGSAGGAGGSAQGCSVAADCQGTPVVVGACALFGADAGFACLDRRCVAECGFDPALTCQVDPAQHCLECPPSASCVPVDCGGGYDFTFTVAEVACAGAAPLTVGAKVREARDGGCAVPFSLATDGGEALWGSMYLQSGRMLTVEVPSLGGSCLALELPTNAPRLIIACPLCQVSLGP